MKVSPYRLQVPLSQSESIVYSTLSTSIIVMDNEEARRIFDECDFSDAATCAELLEMGLLYDETEPQNDILRDSRSKVVNGGTGITGVTIAPTMACNARCFYCFEHGARWGSMDDATADAVADFLVAHCPGKELFIAWFGGEPLMAADTIDRITQRITRSGVVVESTLTTNGILLDDSMRKRLPSWGTYRVQVTLDGIGEEYNRIKSYVGIEEDPFDRVMENIKGLFDMGDLSVHIRLNYRSTDRDAIQKTFDYINRRFGDQPNLYLYGAPLDLPEIKGYSEFDDDEGCLFLDVLHMSLDHGFENDELNFRTGVNVSEDYNAVLGELMLSPFPAPCFMVNKWRYAIDDQGLLYKCQKHLGKREYSCGNVFSGIERNERYLYYTTEELHDEACAECFMLPVCQGGCNANRLLYGSACACPPSKTIASDLVMAYYRYITGENVSMGATMTKYGKEGSDEGSKQSAAEKGSQGA
ncbi:radical SAM/SPASM domain-containing protein [Arabiibacter massiliensis]|uniref:radical SAM/SPASM domain-containing protein n=1 Tax=Arabiibacter massiliensis TaxID=1870985 RepID=UPI0009BB1EDC|nr:radical SAM protein [Arabiibacter massiliensis]